jgi:glycosyltransferase involved in cell wall biosynthesis
VFADHAGFDTLMAGYHLSKKTNITFSPLFWDSLSCGRPVKFLPKKYQDKRKLKIEETILTQCKQAFVLKSNETKIEQIYKNDESCLSKFSFIGVPYLPDENQFPSETKCDASKTVIMFGGSLNGCDIRPLLSGLSKIVDKIKPDLDFCFYVSDIYWKYLSAEINQTGLGNFVRMKPRLSHGDFVKKLESADILVNFGNKTAEALPSKLLEYIATCKPVITTTTNSGDSSAQLIAKYQYGFIYTNAESCSANLNQRLLDFILKAKRAEMPINYTDVLNTFKEYSTSYVVNTIIRKCGF